MRFGSQAWWEFFVIQIDDDGFVVTESRIRKPSVSLSARWDRVSRVVFEDGGLGSDVFWVYESGSTEPIFLPVEATGGEAFWQALKNHGLFPEQISGLAVRSTTQGQRYEWPDANDAGDA